MSSSRFDARKLLRFFDPILAGATLKERLIACLGVMVCLVASNIVSSLIVGHWGFDPILIAPIGASAVLLFVVPASPLAQPWSIVGGNTLSAVIGVIVSIYVDHLGLAVGLAVSLSIILMSLTKSLHPPGGAVALGVVLGGGPVETWGSLYPLVPVALDSILLVIAGIVFHRLFTGKYPNRPSASVTKHQKTSDLPPSIRTAFRDEDLAAALASLNESFDISRHDLTRIYRQMELEGIARSPSNLTCADIMSKDVIQIGANASPKDARALLIDNNIRVLPVVRPDGTLLGTVGIRDLLDGSSTISSVKKAVTARKSQTILSLVPALTDGRNHAVIIVDDDGRVEGLVSQTDLLSALARLVPRDRN